MAELRHIARSFRTSIIGNSSLYHYLRFLRKKRKCDMVIHNVLGDGVDAKRRKEIIRKMKHAMISLHWDPIEFFLFEYEKLSESQRLEFYSEYEKNQLCDVINNKEQAEIRISVI